MAKRQKISFREFVVIMYGAVKSDIAAMRGVKFWERVAGLLWEAYKDLMDLRRRAAKITQQEISRIDLLPKQRAIRAKYMRKYRAKKSAELARYFKEENKNEWREKAAHANATTRSPIKEKQGGKIT